MTRRKTVALLLNDAGLSDNYQGALRRGAERVCVEHDLDLWVYGGRMDWTASGAAQRQLFELVDPTRVDGIVVAAGCIGAYSPIDDVFDRLRRYCPVPVCAVGQFSKGVPNILIDNVGGAARIVEHLVHGHQRRQIAYIAGPLGHEESTQRLQGTREALARVGLELRSEAVRRGNFSAVEGRDLALELLESKVPFDALIAANDDMAVGALELLRSRGLRCPEDVAVAGFDDATSARFSQPSLTTVRQPIEFMGASAVLNLLATWESRDPSDVVTLDTELVIRESCGCQLAGLVPGPGRTYAATAAEAPHQGELIELLTPLLDGEQKRGETARELCASVEAERSGESGAVLQAFGSLLGQLTHPHVHVHVLQRVVTSLRRRARETGDCALLEDAFHAVRVLLSAHASRRTEDRDFRNNSLLRELQLSSEHLATSLSLPLLKEALISHLPRLAIENALVSLYAPGTARLLQPLVCIEEGTSTNIPERSYPAELLVPPGVFVRQTRSSFTVLPLSFESEQLGVVVLELPVVVGAYALLREQIGSAVKTAQLHQEILNQARLHAQVQEEKRATTERLRSLSLIAGGVAHDLNNVLGPLVALPEAIQRDLGALSSELVPAQVMEDLETIRQAGQRAAHTIRDLLALGRLDEMPQSTLELNQLLEGERRTLLGACQRKEGILLCIESSDRPLFIRASKSQLSRAILNLVINAVDATQSPGSITLRAAYRSVPARRLEDVDSLKPDLYAVIEVEDTGVGIPESSLPHVFEPFFTTKHSHATAGTGLGLAIVHRIVTDSMGYVRVESELGKGTTFSLYFPLQDEATGSKSAPPAGSVRPPRQGRERILVVDDELVQLRTARRILGQLGYSVTTARSGQEAVDLCTRSAAIEEFDLVIVDMLMPGLNGLATIEELQRFRPSQKVLIASGYAPEQMDALAKARGLAWLPKPYSVAALAAAVRTALEGSTAHSSNLAAS